MSLAGGLILLPKNPTLEAYRAVLRGGVVTRALQVSVGLVLVGTAGQDDRHDRPGLRPQQAAACPGREFVLFLVLGTLLFSPGLIPSYLLVKNLGLIDTYQSLILPGLISAFNLVILRNFFMNIPQELIESARLDGASDWQVLLAHRPAALEGGRWRWSPSSTASSIWNAFFNAVLYLNDAEQVADPAGAAPVRPAGQRAGLSAVSSTRTSRRRRRRRSRWRSWCSPPCRSWSSTPSCSSTSPGAS